MVPKLRWAKALRVSPSTTHPVFSVDLQGVGLIRVETPVEDGREWGCHPEPQVLHVVTGPTQGHRLRVQTQRISARCGAQRALGNVTQ